jgi:hypothetical protein
MRPSSKGMAIELQAHPGELGVGLIYRVSRSLQSHF